MFFPFTVCPFSLRFGQGLLQFQVEAREACVSIGAELDVSIPMRPMAIMLPPELCLVDEFLFVLDRPVLWVHGLEEVLADLREADSSLIAKYIEQVQL